MLRCARKKVGGGNANAQIQWLLPSYSGEKFAFAPNLAIALNGGVLANSTLQVPKICQVH